MSWAARMAALREGIGEVWEQAELYERLMMIFIGVFAANVLALLFVAIAGAG